MALAENDDSLAAGLEAVMKAIDSGRRKALTSRAKLAARLGISKQAIGAWRKVPVEHVLTIEELFRIPRHRMRPDIYPKPKPKRRVKKTKK